REPKQIVRAAGLEAGARETFTTERLHADDCADHAAVHVDVADARAPHYAIDEALHAAVDSERQAIPARADPGKRALEPAVPENADMQHRAEDFGARQRIQRHFECDRCKPVALWKPWRQWCLTGKPRACPQPAGVIEKRSAGRGIDDRTDVGVRVDRV